MNQRNVLDGLKSYIGDGEPNAEYAQLGFAISNYTRNALLVEKYYSNGQLDEDFELAGVRSEVALSAASTSARASWPPASASCGIEQVEPAIQVAQYEVASVDREGEHRRQVRRPVLLLAGLRRQPGARLPRRLPAGGLRRRRLITRQSTPSPDLDGPGWCASGALVELTMG